MYHFTQGECEEFVKFSKSTIFFKNLLIEYYENLTTGTICPSFSRYNEVFFFGTYYKTPDKLPRENCWLGGKTHIKSPLDNHFLV